MGIDTKELNTITLLYVEDDEMVRTQTLNLFEKIFKKVYSANDGKEGLEKFIKNQNEIEIIVSDINMPNLNGLDMVAKIKEVTANIPVIYTTAHTDSHYLKNALELNIDKYISKPLQMKDLTVNIVDLVLKYRKQKTLEALAKNLVQTTTKNSQIQLDMETKLELLDHKVKHYETLIDNLVFMVHLDKVGNITSVSSKFKTFFGFTDDEIIGSSINDLKCQECAGETFQQIMLKAIHTKKTISSKMTFKTKFGNSIDFDIILTAKYGSDDLVSGYVLYLDLN